MRVTLLHNPGAGANQPTKDDLINALKEKDLDIVYQSTKEKPIDWNKLREESEMFVIAGGDGTVGKISRKLVGSHLPIGILPIGTANNIATSLGIKEDYRHIIKNWQLEKTRSFSVGEASGEWGNDYFIESLGFGLFTHLMRYIYPKDKKRQKEEPEEEIRQAIEHLLRIVPDFKPCYYQIWVDGQDLSGEYIMVEVMNIKCIGPNLMLAPIAEHHDDELEIVLISEKEKPVLIDYFKSKLDNKPKFLDVPYLKGKEVRILSEAEAHIDDEVKSGTKNKTINVCLSKEHLEFLSI